jgi:hypothetical protein
MEAFRRAITNDELRMSELYLKFVIRHLKFGKNALSGEGISSPLCFFKYCTDIDLLVVGLNVKSALSGEGETFFILLNLTFKAA